MLSEGRDWFVKATMGMDVDYDYPLDVSDRDAYPVTTIRLASAAPASGAILDRFGDADVRMATVEIETRALTMEGALAELQRVEDALAERRGERILEFVEFTADWDLEGEPVVQASESFSVIYRG